MESPPFDPERCVEIPAGPDGLRLGDAEHLCLGCGEPADASIQVWFEDELGGVGALRSRQTLELPACRDCRGLRARARNRALAWAGLGLLVMALVPAIGASAGFFTVDEFFDEKGWSFVVALALALYPISRAMDEWRLKDQGGGIATLAGVEAETVTLALQRADVAARIRQALLPEP